MGTVNEYSASKQGNQQVTPNTPNFKVKEFRCKDGSDKVLIDQVLVEYLQIIRNHSGSSINIVSGYRTPSYNKSIGGSATSKHCEGRAADFYARKGVGKINPVKIACMAEVLGLPGIEIISDSNIHLDTRQTESWWTIQKVVNGKRTYVHLDSLGYKSWFGYGKYNLKSIGFSNPFLVPTETLAKGSSGVSVKWLQWQLVLSGDLSLLNSNGVCNIDGSFGAGTERAVKDFQRKHPGTYTGEPDGRVGRKTREELLRIK